MGIEQQLNKIVSDFKQLPYLFIGTGFSMRYADSMSWDDLLYRLWKVVNASDDEYEFKKELNGIGFELNLTESEISDEQKKHYVLPQMASKLQMSFNRQYYNNLEFARKVFSEEENRSVIDAKYDPFKYYVTKLICFAIADIDADKKIVNELSHMAGKQNKIAGIITTNYDDCLEKIFSDFDVVMGQDNMLLANVSSAFEIYKIHGCISSPNTLIFTKEDYDNFQQKLKYLSAKLLTIFVEHPIIFIGYGMGDPNIQNIFKEIAECLPAEELKKAKDNFIFISPIFEDDTKDEIKVRDFTYGSKSISMTEICLKNYSDLYMAFDNIESSMPVKMMRKLQNMVANYIYSTDTTNDILFGNINSPDIGDEKVAIYIGRIDTISQMGFDSFGIEDILGDILHGDKPFLVDERLIFKTFKNIRSTSGVTLLPVYKYIRQLGMTLGDIPKNYRIIKSFEDIKPNRSEIGYIDKKSNFMSLEDIIEKYPTHPPKQHANIKHFAEQISPDELGDYLRERWRNGEYFEATRFSAYKKLTALYDFLKYK